MKIVITIYDLFRAAQSGSCPHTDARSEWALTTQMTIIAILLFGATQLVASPALRRVSQPRGSADQQNIRFRNRWRINLLVTPFARSLNNMFSMNKVVGRICRLDFSVEVHNRFIDLVRVAGNALCTWLLSRCGSLMSMALITFRMAGHRVTDPTSN